MEKYIVENRNKFFSYMDLIVVIIGIGIVATNNFTQGTILMLTYILLEYGVRWSGIQEFSNINSPYSQNYKNSVITIFAMLGIFYYIMWVLFVWQYSHLMVGLFTIYFIAMVVIKMILKLRGNEYR